MKVRLAHQPFLPMRLYQMTQKNQLKDMLPMLEGNIADLVQDADPMRRIFLAIKDNLTPNLAKALIPISNIKDQAPKVKRLKEI